MGFDVYLSRGMRSERELEVARRKSEGGAVPSSEFVPVTWKDVEKWGDFPFPEPIIREVSFSYGYEEGRRGSSISIDVGEITGMSYDPPCLSFHGEHYEELGEAIGLPYSFSRDLSPEQLIEQAKVLEEWISWASDAAGRPIMERLRWEIAVPRAKKWHEKWRLYCFERLVNLHRLLLWMIKHGIGTHAEGGRPEEEPQPTPYYIGLGSNVLIVKDSNHPDDRRVQEVIEWLGRLMLPGGPLLKIIGPASDSVVFAISQAIGHIYGAIAVFDPASGKYVIYASRTPAYATGDLID